MNIIYHPPSGRYYHLAIVFSSGSTEMGPMSSHYKASLASHPPLLDLTDLAWYEVDGIPYISLIKNHNPSTNPVYIMIYLI